MGRWHLRIEAILCWRLELLGTKHAFQSRDNDSKSSNLQDPGRI